MFFFIGGIQPKTKVIETTPRLCPSCGQMTAYMKRIDHYLSFFFIPVFPVKKGNPFILCENCERKQYEHRSAFDNTVHRVEKRCTSCGRIVARDFPFCPYCGKPL